jgi:PAS domain S-box-containing protein
MRHDSQALAPEVQALLDASPDAVVIVDRAGRVVALNHRAEALFATTADRLGGNPSKHWSLSEFASPALRMPRLQSRER